MAGSIIVIMVFLLFAALIIRIVVGTLIRSTINIAIIVGIVVVIVIVVIKRGSRWRLKIFYSFSAKHAVEYLINGILNKRNNAFGATTFVDKFECF